MNHKDNTFKYIRKNLIGPHIIFSAAYMLLGANVAMCTSRRESRLRNLSSAHNQVNASNQLKGLNGPKGDALGVKSRLGRGTLDQEQWDEPFSTTTVVLPEQPVGKDRTIASSSTNISGSVPPLSSANTSASGSPSSSANISVPLPPPMPNNISAPVPPPLPANISVPLPPPMPTNTSASGSPSSSTNTSASVPPPPMPTGQLQTLNTTALNPNQGENDPINTSVTAQTSTGQLQNLNPTALNTNQRGNDPEQNHPTDGSNKKKPSDSQQKPMGFLDEMKLKSPLFRKMQEGIKESRTSAKPEKIEKQEQ